MELVALLASIAAVLVAAFGYWRSVKKSEVANRLSEQSNKIAEDAKRIAQEALDLERTKHTQSTKKEAKVDIGIEDKSVGPTAAKKMIYLRATNSGAVTISLRKAVFQIEEKEIADVQFSGQSDPLELPLESSMSTTRRVLCGEFARALRRQGVGGCCQVQGYFEDNLGDKYFSQLLELNIDEACREAN